MLDGLTDVILDPELGAGVYAFEPKLLLNPFHALVLAVKLRIGFSVSLVVDIIITFQLVYRNSYGLLQIALINQLIRQHLFCDGFS